MLNSLALILNPSKDASAARIMAVGINGSTQVRKPDIRLTFAWKQ